MLVGVLVVIALCFGLGAFFGAPWVPAFRQDFDELFKLAKVGKGTTFVDLGCGDGKVLLAAVKKGAEVTGYEINPILWAIAWLRLSPYGRRAHVRLGSYWSVPVTKYDVVFVFLISHHTARLEKKLIKELGPKSRVISYVFELPHATPTHTTRNSFLYAHQSFATIDT